MKRKAISPSIEPELISLAELRVVLGNQSRHWVYGQLRDNPAFPRPLKLDSRRNAWRLREVRAYIEELPRHELTGLSGPQRRVAERNAT